MADSPESRILLMRHGQTTANLSHCFLGQRNAPLTPAGKLQSQRAAEGLLRWSPCRIFSSPLRRCHDAIALPASQHLGVPLTVDERLAELDFGPLEGQDYHQAQGSGRPLPWGPTSAQWPPPSGGEPVEAFMGRLADIAGELTSLSGRTAVVCHGGVIRGFLSLWDGFDFNRFWEVEVGNVASFEFAVEQGKVRLVGAGLSPEQLV